MLCVMSSMIHTSPTRHGMTFPYQLRARFMGSLEWVCPRCGKINRSRMTWRSWRARCKGASCKQRYIVRLRLGVLTEPYQGPKRVPPPPDYIFPSHIEVFPKCDLTGWRWDEHAHSLVEE